MRSGAVVQPVFTASKAFKRQENAKTALEGIKAYLQKSDEEMRWAIQTPALEVHFDIGPVATEEEAWGTTQFLIGETDLMGMNVLQPERLLQLLKSPSRKLKVKITIDEGVVGNQGQTILALSHEIGAHLKPRLAFIRKVVEHGVSSEDLVVLLNTVEHEHAGVYHSHFEQAPQNTTYFQLVAAFASLIDDRETRQTFLSTYLEDVRRYSPEEESAEFNVAAIIGQSRQRQLALQRFVTNLVKSVVLLAIVAAILLVVCYRRG